MEHPKALSADECKDEFKATLDHLSRTALLQYTFTAALFYGYLYPTTERIDFLGFRLVQIDWLFCIYLALIGSYVYVGQQLHYLKLLGEMHAENCKKLSFVIQHHHWLLNPFHETWGLLPYLIIIFAPMQFLTITSMNNPAYFSGEGTVPLAMAWFNALAFGVIGIGHMFAILFVWRQINEVENALGGLRHGFRSPNIVNEAQHYLKAEKKKTERSARPESKD